MHVFVTGVGGFVGTRLVENFVGRGWKVTGLSRRATAGMPTLPRELFSVVVSDAADLSELPDTIDAVVHVAATMPFGGASMHQLLHDNVLATRRLIELSVRCRVRAFVFFSSTSVFGRDHTGVLSDLSDVVNPEEYGVTKILCEKLLSDVADRLPSIALRLPAVIGAGAGRNWVASLAAQIIAGQDLKIFNASARFNTCVHVADVAELIAQQIAAGFAGSEAAILCADGTTTIREAVDIVMQGLGRTVPVHEVPPARDAFTVSCEKARQIWNWRPMTVAQSLSRYAEEQRHVAGAASRS